MIGQVFPEMSPQLSRAVWGTLIVLVGLIVARGLAELGARIAASRSRQTEMVTRRLVFGGIGSVALLAGLRHAGVDPSVLLGTAGILTVALGFASQTSASNLISGVFLLFERPFVVGDIIRVGTTTGEVLSVDMLSVKLRTFDNLFVRVPNETLLKSEIANISHFPIRRVDLKLAISYGEDMPALRAALFEIAAENSYVLDEPTPMVIIDEFRESSVVVQFSAWAARERFLDAKNSLLDDVQTHIYDGRFRIPYPVRMLMESTPPEPGSPGPRRAASGTSGLSSTGVNPRVLSPKGPGPEVEEDP